jgi:hypothetical protein
MHDRYEDRDRPSAVMSWIVWAVIVAAVVCGFVGYGLAHLLGGR